MSFLSEILENVICSDKLVWCCSQVEDLCSFVRSQNVLVRWATYNQQGVGLPCGQAVGVTASSQWAIQTDTPTHALYKLGCTNRVLHRKDHQGSALRAFPWESFSLSTGHTGQPGTSNTGLCKHSFLILPWKVKRSAQVMRLVRGSLRLLRPIPVPSPQLYALPFVLADAL